MDVLLLAEEGSYEVDCSDFWFIIDKSVIKSRVQQHINYNKRYITGT